VGLVPNGVWGGFGLVAEGRFYESVTVDKGNCLLCVSSRLECFRVDEELTREISSVSIFCTLGFMSEELGRILKLDDNDSHR